MVDSIIRMFENRNAVVMYLSDHGEEVHNFRNQYGRTDINKDCRESYAPQFDIPFMVYLTPSYAKEHPEWQLALKLLAIEDSQTMTLRKLYAIYLECSLPMYVCSIASSTIAI